MDALDRIAALLASTDTNSAGTSMRLDVSLRDAARIGRDELGWDTATELAAAGLRDRLEQLLHDAALEAHYALHPPARPSLAEVTVAYAEQTGHPLADHIEEIARAIQTAGATLTTPAEVLAFVAGARSARIPA
jgi:hypothetical protein